LTPLHRRRPRALLTYCTATSAKDTFTAISDFDFLTLWTGPPPHRHRLLWVCSLPTSHSSSCVNRECLCTMLFLFPFSSLSGSHVLSSIARSSLISCTTFLFFRDNSAPHQTSFSLYFTSFLSLANKQDPGIAGGLGKGKTKRPHWHIRYRQNIIMEIGDFWGVDTYLYIT
jgi:hypothetical protein